MDIAKEKKKIAIYSVFLNLFLTVLKVGAGLLSGSASLVADGIHSLADLAASLSVFAGIVIASMRVKGFPYGLYKVENVVSLISAVAIFFAGFEIGREVLFSEHTIRIKNLPVAVGAVLLTILITYLFSKYERKKGEELHSPSLIADSEHIKTDMFSALVVLVGIIGNYFGYPFIEKLAVLIIVVLIFHAGYEIFIESLKVLLDASLDKETLDGVKEILLSHPLVSKVKSITGRSSGSYKFIEADITFLTNDLKKAHSVVHEVEAKVRKEYPFIEKMVIHLEPEERKENLVAIPINGNRVCDRFSECPQILLVLLKDGSYQEVGRLENKAANLKYGKCIKLVEELAKRNVNCVAVNNLPLGKGVIYALSSYGIGMKFIPEEDLSKFLSELSKDPHCEPPLAVWERFTCDISSKGGKN